MNTCKTISSGVDDSRVFETIDILDSGGFIGALFSLPSPFEAKVAILAGITTLRL